jgi:transposase-like protein
LDSWPAGAPRRRGVPDPELVEQAKRRTFTAEYKAKILAKADACTRPGEIGELLRAEGLYTSHLTYWRKQRKNGALFRVVDAAYEKRSIAISSNIHPSGFDELMPKTMATATVDRLLHHAHVISNRRAVSSSPSSPPLSTSSRSCS